MKILKIAGVALVSVGLNLIYTGCERHDFEGSTKALYEKHGDHGDHGEEHHDGDGEHHDGDKAKPAGGGEHHEGEKKHADGAEGGKKVF